MSDDAREARLRALFDEHADDVLRYALRRIDAATAQDIVSDTFLVAWRRLSEIPEPALPWLLVVARNSISNRVRGMTRHQRLVGALAAVADAAATASITAIAAEDLVVERAGLVAALGTLSDAQREALLLVAWDGLSTADAATVAGCTRSAFQVRLHRARARLREALSESDPVHSAPDTRPKAVRS